MSVVASTITTGAQASAGSANTASVSPVANRLYVLTVFFTTSTIPTVSGAGMTWTEIAHFVGSHGVSVAMFRSLSNSPGSGVLTISFSSGTPNIYWTLTEFQGIDIGGVNGANAIIQNADNEGSGSSNGGNSSLIITLNSFQSTSNATYGVMLGITNIASLTKGGNFTELVNQQLLNGVGGATAQIEAEFATNAQTSVPWSIATTNSGNDSTNDAGMAIEIKAFSFVIPFVNQPYFYPFDQNIAGVPRPFIFIPPSFLPPGFSSWAASSIAQPYFPTRDINPYSVSTPSVSTYFKPLGWYKIKKPTDVWTKIAKTKIVSG